MLLGTVSAPRPRDGSAGRRRGAMTVTGRTDATATGAPPPTFCDFCGRTTADAGPMVEGNALVRASVRAQGAHVCADLPDSHRIADIS